VESRYVTKNSLNYLAGHASRQAERVPREDTSFGFALRVDLECDVPSVWLSLKFCDDTMVLSDNESQQFCA
jgi:hypothetical protein